MKHWSKKETSSGPKVDWPKSQVVPISIVNVLEKRETVHKDLEEMWELTIRTDPADKLSLCIKLCVKVLDNPNTVLDVLKAREAIKEGLLGNNITSGPNQYCYRRSFLAGKALRLFNEKAASHTGKMVNHLTIPMNEVVTLFTPRECLSKQKRYIWYAMCKPYNITTRQYIGAVRNLNKQCIEMPPNF